MCIHPLPQSTCDNRKAQHALALIFQYTDAMRVVIENNKILDEGYTPISYPFIFFEVYQNEGLCLESCATKRRNGHLGRIFGRRRV